MKNNIQILFSRLRSQLWFRPAMFCLFAIICAFVARLADQSDLQYLVPQIKDESIEQLLKTLSSSMLVIAIFAVGSMISAFTAASSSATPRSFKLIIADDSSQNALSVFIGSFIFSIVGLVALKNGYYARGGHFVLFIITILFFVVVILTFIRWVDKISRLGRINHTIKLIEDTTARSTKNYLEISNKFARSQQHEGHITTQLFSKKIGYVQNINALALQNICAEHDVRLSLKATPGTFAEPTQPLATIFSMKKISEEMVENIRDAFTIDEHRTYETDVRFGHITLSEIASRALSPAVNDPGTAIQILSSQVRLFYLWHELGKNKKNEEIEFDRVEMPPLTALDLLKDAFRPIARDGATNVEVMIRLQKSLKSISKISYPQFAEASIALSTESYERAAKVMVLKTDLEIIKQLCLKA